MIEHLANKYNESLSYATVWGYSCNLWDKKRNGSNLNLYCHVHPFKKIGRLYLGLFASIATATLLYCFGSAPDASFGNLAFCACVLTFNLYMTLAPVFMQLVHKLLPLKEERLNLLKDKFDAKFNPLKVNNPIDWDLFNSNLKSFCLAHFGKNGPGFINFIKERVEDDRQFLNYALSLPKRKDMSVDRLRKVLGVYSSSLGFGDVILDLESAFRNYTPEEVERAFCGIGWDVDMFKVIIPQLIKNNKPLPIVRNLKKLEQLSIKDVPSWLKAVTGEHEGFKFQVLESGAEYGEASDTMNNCIRTKINNNSYILLVTCLEDNYLTAVEVSPQKNITQMAGNHDRISKYRNKIGRILMKKGMKVVCNLPHVF